MDIAKTLIRSVARAFYDTKHVLVVDALMIHSALPNEDLAFVLGMQQKDLRKLCGKLREDRLLAVHSRPEIRDGMTRPVNKDYYYIDFHSTIDAIKYRMYSLTEKVKELYRPSHEKKDYFCPQCHAQWTQLEVLDRSGPHGFECHRCGGSLEREERQEGDSTGHEKQSKLMSQLDGFIKMLQQIDNQDIPKNDFDTALSLAVPVQRDATANPLRPYQPVDKSQTSTAAKGLTQATVVPLDVSVTTSSDRTAAEKAEEAKRKASIAAQNILPVWHTTSTVTGEKALPSNREGESRIDGSPLVKGEREEKKDTNVLNDELTAYYAQMLQEKEKEAREDREADESSGDDDEEFEDVEVGQSTVHSPSSSTPASTQRAEVTKLVQNGKPSESESSAPATNASTPAAGAANGQVESEVPASKRVKFEGLANGTHGVGKDWKDAIEKDSDEDEGIEFEDV
ncbi:MAG: hypothetical protein Q9217_000860 [Psora testacea]